MARRTDGGVRFRPVGSSRHPRTPVRYSPGGTGCPAIEQAIEQLDLLGEQSKRREKLGKLEQAV